MNKLKKYVIREFLGSNFIDVWHENYSRKLATNYNFLNPKSLQPDGVDLLYFKGTGRQCNVVELSMQCCGQIL